MNTRQPLAVDVRPRDRSTCTHVMSECLSILWSKRQVVNSDIPPASATTVRPPQPPSPTKEYSQSNSNSKLSPQLSTLAAHAHLTRCCHGRSQPCPARRARPCRVVPEPNPPNQANPAPLPQTHPTLTADSSRSSNLLFLPRSSFSPGHQPAHCPPASPPAHRLPDSPPTPSHPVREPTHRPPRVILIGPFLLIDTRLVSHQFSFQPNPTSHPRHKVEVPCLHVLSTREHLPGWSWTGWFGAGDMKLHDGTERGRTSASGDRRGGPLDEYGVAAVPTAARCRPGRGGRDGRYRERRERTTGQSGGGQGQ